jgi:hypothetical protein
METCIYMTVGDLVAALFDETRNLNWLKRRKKNLLVAITSVRTLDEQI